MNLLTASIDKLFFIILVGVLSAGCVEEIEVFKGSTPVLVVDGNITNEPGPHGVQLAFSKTYGERPSYFAVEQAVVKIIDDQGNEELLTYDADGLYLSSADFQGQIGRSYHLEVTLKTGVKYVSEPELLKEVAPVDKIVYEREQNELVFYADFTDNSETQDYYRWRYRTTYQVEAPLALTYMTNVVIPSKNGCFEVNRYGRPIFDRVPDCWITTSDIEFLKVENDLLFNGREMKKYKVFSVELDNKFNIGYDAEIRQFSLTKRAYNYWKAIQEQIGNNGSIFETSNYHIKGNIYAEGDKNADVLGYFSASAVSYNHLFIDDFRGTFDPIDCSENEAGCIPNRCIDCRNYSPNATDVKPAFWLY